MKDLRQSRNWANYMKELGWEAVLVDGVYVYIKKIGFVSVIKIHRANTISTQLLKKIDSLAKENKALFIKIELNEPEKSMVFSKTAEKEIALLKRHGYVINFFPLLTPSTIVVDLTKNEQDLFKALKEDARYSVKKAQKSGIKCSFKRFPTIEEMKMYQEFFERAGKERHLLVPTLNSLRKRLKAFGKKAIFVETKNLKNEILSAGVILIFQNTGYYSELGTLQEGRKLLANYLQLWEIIKFLKSEGLKNFDMDGIADERFPQFTKTWAGFSFFKKKFGGEVYRYPFPYIKYGNIIFKLLGRLGQPLPI
ncbi:MAG: peptidoglycan bridge formation glycyltransferase FemA/FemB family protein [Patescibacteria group bacterium]